MNFKRYLEPKLEEVRSVAWEAVRSITRTVTPEDLPRLQAAAEHYDPFVAAVARVTLEQIGHGQEPVPVPDPEPEKGGE